MPSPYSNDLRERVFKTHLNGDLTYAEVGTLFSVGEASVDRWVSRYRRTASVAPDAMGGDRLSKFNAASEALLREMVMAAPDAKRDELVAALRDTGLVVSPATVQRALARLGFTRKKRLSTLRSVTQRV